MIQSFIKKSIIYLVIWVVLIYSLLIFFPLSYNMHAYPMYLNKMELINSKFDYKNLIIGDSRTIAGIDPQILGKSYYNLGLSGGTPVEGYFTLKKILENENKIDTILVSYGPFHLQWSDTFWERQLKYNFYEFKDINEIFYDLNTEQVKFWKEDVEKLDSSILYFVLKAYLIKLRFPIFYRNELKNSLLLRGENNKKVYREIKNNKGQYLFGEKEFSHDLNYEAEMNSFEAKLIFINSLDKIFSLAANNDIQVVYINPPFNKSSYNKLNKTYIEDYNNSLQKLKIKFSEVIFSSDIMYYEDNFFGDASHLNEKGKIKFSEEIKKKLNTNLVNSKQLKDSI